MSINMLKKQSGLAMINREEFMRKVYADIYKEVLNV